jgi:hypothetical protein
MDTKRLKCLIAEYKNAKKKLEAIKERYEKIKVSTEISRDLDKELTAELSRAQELKDSEAAKYWQDIIAKFYCNDKELTSDADLQKAQKEVSQEHEKFIMYYEKKLKIIRRLLGARLTQLLENYEEKNILMGEESGSRSEQQLSEEEEQEEEKKEKERKTGYTFNKM